MRADQVRQVVTGLKFCRRCHIEQPASSFYSKADAGDGLDPYCKTCRRETGYQAGKVRNEAARRLIAAHPDEWRQLREAVRDEMDRDG